MDLNDTRILNHTSGEVHWADMAAGLFFRSAIYNTFLFISSDFENFLRFFDFSYGTKK